eukprot:COSAG05_NODE_2132_length_3505_cov_2.454492_2_plen_182_part_00
MRRASRCGAGCVGAGWGGSWLRALGEAERLQRPLRFTAHGEGLELSEEGTVVTGSGNRSAVCGDHEMRRGRHYATFTLGILGQYGAGSMLGVVGAGFDPAGGGSAKGCPQGWMLYSFSGHLLHANRCMFWEGQPQRNEARLEEGDVVVRLPLSACPCACPAAQLTQGRSHRACCLTSTRPP